MAFQLPATPNFNSNIPQATPPLDTYAKMLQLKMLQGQQQLQPLQMEEAQQDVQAKTLQNQKAQIDLKSREAMNKAWSDPDFSSNVTGDGKEVAPAIGFTPGFDPIKMIKALVSKGVQAPDAMAQASSFLELSKNLSLKTKDDLSNYKEAHQQLANLIAPITSMKVEEAGPALDAVKQKVASGAIPGLDPRDVQLLQQADLGHLRSTLNLINVASQVADFHKGQSEATKAEQEAINATPGGMAARTKAEEQAKLEVESSPQALELARKKTEMEANARQQAAQGDPNVAGKLLADGSLTIADLKTRGTTPQFIEKATLAAQKVNPHYNPADEVIAESVAKSQTANQFFGSANSLIGKGGTLDQLEKLGGNVPQHDFPALNTVDDWQKIARGKGPLAAYAATALGVADDYGKVMGGGTASDHARDAALQLFAQAASPEQRAEAIQATRDAVQSQRDSRIGNNQFLKRQYGVETGGTPKAAAPSAHKVGDLIVQNGQTFKATKIDKNGKVLAADPQ